VGFSQFFKLGLPHKIHSFGGIYNDVPIMVDTTQLASTLKMLHSLT